MSIQSLPVERHALAGLINHPYVFSMVAPYASDKDFYSDVHSVTFSILRDMITKGEKIDKVLVAQKIKNLGISFKDSIDIHEYIGSITFSEISPEATIDAFKELITLRIRRDYFELGSKLQNHAKMAGNKTLDEIVCEGDSIYGSLTSSFTLEDQPKNLFEDIESFVEDRGNNPVEESGFVTPYPNFNRLYGGLRKKNVYAFVSRPAQGKSSMLSDLAFNSARLSGFKTKALLLDTEMETEDLKWRIVSSISGVPMWYLETGNWRKNEDMIKSVRAALELAKHYQFDHLKVGNKTIDQVCALARRWYYSKVGRDGSAIIAYDYIKLTGEKVSESWKEHQVIGEKVDKIKKLAEELDVPLIVAMQMNRQGENHNRKSADVTDDSSAIALSDRLQWFASFVGIFRRKVIEEMVEDGMDFGTHKLIPTKTRFQGKDAAGHQDLIKRRFKDGSEKYTNNYLSFSVDNFSVKEKGSVKEIMESQKLSIPESDESKEDSEIL